MEFRPFKRAGPIKLENQVTAYLTKRSMSSFNHFLSNLKFLGALFVKEVTFCTLTLTSVRNVIFATDNIWNLTHPSRLSVSY